MHSQSVEFESQCRDYRTTITVISTFLRNILILWFNIGNRHNNILRSCLSIKIKLITHLIMKNLVTYVCFIKTSMNIFLKIRLKRVVLYSNKNVVYYVIA